MNLEWRDPNTGQIKIWVWAVGGGVALVGIMLLMRTSSSTSAGVVSGGQSSDISDQLSQLQDALTQLSDQSEPTPNPNPDPNPDPIPVPTPNDTKTYKIKAGDTLNGIAAGFGLTLDTLRELNPNLKGWDKPNAKRGGGAFINIPINALWNPTPTPPPNNNPKTYQIKKNDTLAGIASQFGISLTKLKKLNPDLRGFNRPNAKRGGGATIRVGGGNSNIKS